MKQTNNIQKQFEAFDVRQVDRFTNEFLHTYDGMLIEFNFARVCGEHK